MRFEHLIVLNPDKKYRLGVSHLMLSFDKEVKIDLRFEFYIKVPDDPHYYIIESTIVEVYTIDSLQKTFQEVCYERFAGVLAQTLKYKHLEINQKLKNFKISPVKFELKKLDDAVYVIVFNFPFKFKFIYNADDDFCQFFKFHKSIQSGTTYEPNIDYVSENILQLLSPLSVTEWHCNTTEYSYANHDDHPHIHKHFT